MTCCPFCSSTNGHKQYSTCDIYGEEFKVLKCPSCRSYYLSPQPTEAYLQKAYNSSYYGEGEQKFRGIIQRGINYLIARRARQLSHITGSRPKVLDIGCGSGYFLQNMIKVANARAYGIELPGKSAERAANVEGLNLKIGRLEAGDFDEEDFDLITLFHVYEHLPNPAEILEICSHILKRDGHLFLSCPNIASWQSQRFKGHFFHLDPPRHLFLMAPDDIISHMEKLGMLCVRQNYFNPKYNPYGYFQSWLNKRGLKRDLLFEHLKGNHNYGSEYSPASLWLQKWAFRISLPALLLSDWVAARFKRSATVELVFRKS